jgi:hypothetical protein
VVDAGVPFTIGASALRPSSANSRWTFDDAQRVATLASGSLARQAEVMAKPFAVIVDVVTPKRRWAQFSLGTMFIVVAQLCVWMAVKVNRAHALRRALDHVERLGGNVVFDHQLLDGVELDTTAEPPGPAWLRQLLGDEYFVEVACLNLGATTFNVLGGVMEIQPTNAGNGDLAVLDAMPNLVLLNLAATNVDHAVLNDVARPKRLKRLSLDGTRITDACLETNKAQRNPELGQPIHARKAAGRFTPSSGKRELPHSRTGCLVVITREELR